tara:strand:- start:10068 stop:10172 length:105 start_codon:yes stop_codon:yes gene_type:complete
MSIIEGLTIMVVIAFGGILLMEMVIPHKDSDKKD